VHEKITHASRFRPFWFRATRTCSLSCRSITEMKHRRRSLTTSVQAHAEHFLNLSQKTDSVRTRNHLVFLAIKATTFHNSGVIRRRGYAPRGAPLVYSHGNDAWARKAVSAGIASSGALFTALLDVSVNGWRFRDLLPKPGFFPTKPSEAHRLTLAQTVSRP